MAETRFVVEVSEPVAGELVGEIAARIAGRFAMDESRVRKLVEGRTGPVTRPLPKDKAERIARAFRDAGVAVRVLSEPHQPAPAATAGRAPPEPSRPGQSEYQEPPNVFLSSTRWVPSPHEAPAIAAESGAVVEGPPTSVPAEAREGAPSATPRPGAEPIERAPAWMADDAWRPGGPVAASRAPGLRRGLFIGFLVALLLLLALQALMSLRSGARSQAGVDAGMRAYSSGDFSEARRVWTPLAKSGSARAEYMLGYMAENGQGRAWSNHDAATWYRRAADQGYPQAQVALGQLFARGMGVERNPTRAAGLYRAAAREGYGPGQFQYALALFHGTGVPQDFAAALTWFKAAAANGVAEARPYVSFAGSAGQAEGAGPPGGSATDAVGTPGPATGGGPAAGPQ